MGGAVPGVGVAELLGGGGWVRPFTLRSCAAARKEERSS